MRLYIVYFCIITIAYARSLPSVDSRIDHSFPILSKMSLKCGHALQACIHTSTCWVHFGYVPGTYQKLFKISYLGTARCELGTAQYGLGVTPSIVYPNRLCFRAWWEFLSSSISHLTQPHFCSPFQPSSGPFQPSATALSQATGALATDAFCSCRTLH